MKYYLCRNDGKEECTACYDTIEQVEQWAEIQKKNWHTQAGEWYVKQAVRFDKPGKIIRKLS